MTKIKVGDRVEITLAQPPWYWCDGIVTSAINYAKPWEDNPKDDWYIELDVIRGSGISPGTAYWKQGVDGGTVTVMRGAVMNSVTRGKVYNEGGHILGPGDIVPVKFVTVIGEVGDFAVYMGESSQADDDVAMYGDKVLEDVARAVAPYCQHLKYRR